MLGLLGLVAALAPFPFGSNDPSIMTVWCGLLGLGLVLSAFVRIGRAQSRMLVLVFAVFVCIAGVVVIQLGPGNWLASPDRLWSQASDALGQRLVPSLSVVRWEPLYGLGPTLGFVATISLAIVVGSHRVGAERLRGIVAWAGLAYALYGIIASIAAPTMVLWQERNGYTGNVTGTFTQRNTAATFFGMIALVWFVRVCEALRRELPPGSFTWKRFDSKVLSRPRREIMVPFVAAMICFMALFMTGSRAGTILSLLAIVVTIMAMFWQDLPRSGLRTRFLIGGVIATLLVLQFFGGIVTNRFNAQGLDGEARWEIFLATTRIVADHPWFGTGLGTFPWIFPTYRPVPPEMIGTYVRAFCTPLEMASELGIPVVGIIAAAIFGTLVMLVRKLANSGERRPGILIALMTALLALAHSSIDYPLQVPGFALVAAALIGAGIGQALGSSPIARQRTSKAEAEDVLAPT